MKCLGDAKDLLYKVYICFSRGVLTFSIYIVLSPRKHLASFMSCMEWSGASTIYTLCSIPFSSVIFLSNSFTLLQSVWQSPASYPLRTTLSYAVFWSCLQRSEASNCSLRPPCFQLSELYVAPAGIKMISCWLLYRDSLSRLVKL